MRLTDHKNIKFAATVLEVEINCLKDKPFFKIDVPLKYPSDDLSKKIQELNDRCTQIDQLIQAMATFSTDNGGISWEQALVDKPDEINRNFFNTSCKAILLKFGNFSVINTRQ